jgi:hypothetical protein
VLSQWQESGVILCPGRKLILRSTPQLQAIADGVGEPGEE